MEGTQDMAVPDYQSLMLPLLRTAANGKVCTGTVMQQLADELGLDDGERAEIRRRTGAIPRPQKRRK